MAATRNVTVLVKGVPPDLKAQLIAAVDEQRPNLNDVIVALLAEHYAVGFAPSGYRRQAQADPDVSTIEVRRVPAALYRALTREVTDRRLRGEDVTQSLVIIEKLAGALPAAA